MSNPTKKRPPKIDKQRLLRAAANLLRTDPSHLSICERCGRVVIDKKPCCS